MFSPIKSISIPYKDIDNLIETLTEAKKRPGCKVTIEDYSMINPMSSPSWFIDNN